MFAKKDMANIGDAQLVKLRGLANVYATLTTEQVDQVIREQDWFEVCN